MNIIFENPDKVNGLLTLTVEETDYKEAVEKTLKDYRRKANVPGFRPGMVPMGMIKRQYGTAVKADEVNKLVGQEIYKYLQENKIQMLGEPLPSEKQVPQDLEKDSTLTFVFDIAVAPEFKANISGRDKVDYYTITVDDKLIDQQVDSYASRSGSYEAADTFDAGQRDLLRGNLCELDKKGKKKEDGITVENTALMPQYMKDEDQKKLFEGAKKGSTVVFNPRKAYGESDVEIASLLKIDKEEAKNMTFDFEYEITEISRYKKAEINQALFDQAFGKDAVKSEQAFRDRIASDLKRQFEAECDWKFLQDVRKHMEKKVGKLEFPEELLKRVMLQNNKEKGEKYVEDNFAASIKELKWHLIKEQLVAATEIKVEDSDVKNAAKEMARMQFAQYGMTNVPEEYLDNYASEMLKKQEQIDGLINRAIDQKLIEKLKGIVKLNEKEVTLEEFNEQASK